MNTQRTTPADTTSTDTEVFGLAESAGAMPGLRGDDSRVFVLDSQIGGDLDELIALWVAARTIRQLVVVTSDETRGRRAALARLVLDELGRPEVPVIAGEELDDAETRFVFGDYPLPVVTESQATPSHVIAARAEHAPVTVIGLGALTNVAELFCVHPHLAENIDLVIQGGWLDHYRKPRASHNFHIDQVSTGIVLRMAHRPRLIFSTYTNDDRLCVTPDSPLVAWFRSSDTGFARLAAEYCDRWFAHRPHGSWQADSVAVAVALGAPVAEFTTEHVWVAPDARLYRDPNGRPLTVSTAIHYSAFEDWLSQVIPEAPLHAHRADSDGDTDGHGAGA
ncbi:hypothetical protein GZH49_12040 [Nocardia terpenica]|uniref:nucleoside hydrolase n=1 Tax=Nocardia terpenica TaxID=455432 RepID=UPI002FE30B72